MRAFLVALFVTNLCAAAPLSDEDRKRIVPLLTKGSPLFQQAVDNYLKQIQPKIVGGKPAKADAYPWQVSLGISLIGDPYYAHFCAGAIVDPQWVITAAHCVINTDPDDISITVGTNVLQRNSQRIGVQRIYIQPQYNRATKDGDVALIKLAQSLSLSASIQPVALASDDEETAVVQNKTNVTVLGWGATEEGGAPTRMLQYVSFPLVEREICSGAMSYYHKITENMLCAGRLAGKDSCQGDSGGALTGSTANSVRLLGVVSWGDGCARPNRVGVYARITRYSNWVNACMQGDLKCTAK